MPRIGVTLPFPHCFPVILIELLIGLSIGDRWPGRSRSRSRSGRTKAAPAVEEIGKRYIRKLGKSASSRMGRGPEPGAPSSHPIFFFLGFYFPGAFSSWFFPQNAPSQPDLPGFLMSLSDFVEFLGLFPPLSPHHFRA